MKKHLLAISFSVALVLGGCSSQTANKGEYSSLAIDAPYSKPRTQNNFNDYVNFLKQKAAGAGVSAKTLKSQQFIQYNARSIELDQQQAARRRDPNLPPLPPNPNGVTNYLNKVLSQNKVNQAVDRWYEYGAPLEKASAKFGVQKEYIMALWGMESSFGNHQGDFDEGTLSRYQMVGSWAGAMGQTQFMPTAYLSYAADGDGDGKKDIWNNEADAFASIASYLSTVGWDNSLPWGVEVKLSSPIDISFSGIEDNKAKSLGEWQSWGVYLAYPNGRESAKLAKMNVKKLWLVRPDKEAGRAFLVTSNFRTLMDWNKSNNFGISIGKFADRILEGVGQ